MNLSRQSATFGLVATAATTGTNIVGTNPIGTRATQATFPDTSVVVSFKATGIDPADSASWDLQTGVVTALGGGDGPTLAAGDGKDFEGITLPVSSKLYGILVEFERKSGAGTMTMISSDAAFPDIVMSDSGALLLSVDEGAAAAGTIAFTFSDALDLVKVTAVADTRYSSYSILFDDVDDYVYGGTTGGADYNGGTPANKTYSFWAKTTEESWNGVFDHGAATRGAFHFTVYANRPLLYMGSANYRYWVSNASSYDGTWHHHAVVLTTDISAAKYYLDGVEQAIVTTVSTGAQNSYTHAVRPGRGGNYWYDGNLDEFAVFDGELSAASILAIYNSGNPADLSAYSPEVWWRMGDGDIGTSEVINHGSGVFTPAAGVLYGGATFVIDTPIA